MCTHTRTKLSCRREGHEHKSVWEWHVARHPSRLRCDEVTHSSTEVAAHA